MWCTHTHTHTHTHILPLTHEITFYVSSTLITPRRLEWNFATRTSFSPEILFLSHSVEDVGMGGWIG